MNATDDALNSVVSVRIVAVALPVYAGCKLAHKKHDAKMTPRNLASTSLATRVTAASATLIQFDMSNLFIFPFNYLFLY